MSDQALREWVLAWNAQYNVAHDAALVPLHGRASYTIAELTTILKWKLQPNYLASAVNTLATLPPEYVTDLIARAINNADDLAAYLLLSDVKGMRSGWAIPSAILMTSNPDRYTVYDRRAKSSLTALGLLQSDPAKGVWLNYLHSCRLISRRVLLPLRTVDRALYQAKGSATLPSGFIAPEPHWFGAFP